MYEIKITEKFCRYPQYFDTFSSCNRNFHINKTKNNARWCGVCPKCAFVYTLMSAFLPQKKIIQIFGKNMFADPSLKQLFQELLGISGIKPFECVGTNEEMILAMYKYCQQSKPETSETPIIKLFKSQVLTKMQESDFFALEKKLTKIYTEYNIPKEIESKFLLS
ncbi:hypothetical protein KKG31_03610 [Patescibacteria group bacterium]|nr:hypothetical protein [Patescibacteria group bacterium]MBU1758233.1 hypothetical protein [Patescibacteria group bacterium]